MHRPSVLLRLATFGTAFLMAFPSAFAAVSVESLIQGADTGTVTRGDFIRAAVQVLKISTAGVETPLPYNRVPKALEPYIRVAERHGALAQFGSDLTLARSITRGQAALIVGKFLNLHGGTVDSFRDVPKGSELETAAQIIVANGWLQPLGEGLFGANRVLTVRDARLFLRKAAGEDFPSTSPSLSDTPTQTVRITFTGKKGKMERYPLPKTEILETIWKLLNDDFLYNEKMDPDEAAYSAAEGLVKSLGDPYTSFLRPISSKNFQQQIQGEVSGIGAQVEERDGVLTVVSPLTGSPAQKAGLLPGDQILMVDGVSLKGLNFLEAVEKVRGPTGSVAKLHVRRNGTELDINVTRETVRVPEIEISWQGDIAVVRIVQFGKLTDTELRKHMVDLQADHPKGLVLDLRNNPGGLLHAAQTVVSNFVPLGTPVAKIKRLAGITTASTEEQPTMDANLPIVVLVNAGSASAAEIVAGALQDHGRAKIVGEKTFGKGTVQQIVEFNDSSSLKMTIAEWLTPKDRRIEHIGLMPDIVVTQTQERDEQMLKALELIR